MGKNTEQTEAKQAGMVTAGSPKKYKKANVLISAKYKSTLLENKLLAIALSDLQNARTRKDGYLVATIPASTLRKVIGDKSGSLYGHLKTTAQRMMTRSLVGFEDDENKRFSYVNLITKASYSDGTLQIEFAPDIKKYALNIQEKYTSLELPLMMQFDSVYSFRLYELLKSHAYVSKKYPETFNNQWKVPFSLAELKMELGVVDASDHKIQKLLDGSETPDYEAALESLPKEKRKFDSWTDFRRRVIETAVNEINEITDMQVSYEAERTGRGGKVSGLVFEISYRRKSADSNSPAVMTPSSPAPQNGSADLLLQIDAIQKATDMKLTLKDCITLLEDAGYDLDRVMSAVEVANSQKTPISNLVGFLRSAIRENYTAPDTEYVSSKPKKLKANDFNNFQQNRYDFNELEEKLLK